MVENWKNGDSPHKLVCGKRSAELPPSRPSTNDSAISLSRADIPVPQPSPGYTRSLALQYVIWHIGRLTMADYVLVVGKGGVRPVILLLSGVTSDNQNLADSSLKARFHHARDRAFANGDPDAVMEMHAILREYVHTQGFTDVDLRSQLKREYGVDVGETSAAEDTTYLVEPESSSALTAVREFNQDMLLSQLRSGVQPTLEDMLNIVLY